MYINVEMDDQIYKGDEIVINCTIDESLDNWEIRAEIFDLTGNSVKIATSNVTGGSVDQIATTHLSGASTSSFVLTFAEDLTTNFDDDAWIEIERTDASGHKKTIYKAMFPFINEQITWDDVS